MPPAQRSSSPLSALSPLDSAADATSLVASSPRSSTTAASGSPNSSNGVAVAGPPPSVLLQLGRMGPHEFSVDMRHPLTPLQAFAIVLSQFDGKIGVD